MALLMRPRTALSAILIIAATALAPAWVGAQPPPPNISTILVPAPDSGAPMLWLGFFAFGDQASIDRLAAAVQVLGWRGGQVETQGTEKEYGVFFDSNTTFEQASAFGRRVTGGEFGRLRVESMIVPPSAVSRPSR